MTRHAGSRVRRSTTSAGRRVFTVGHSNHPLERFLALLREHAIDLVADARSQPVSRRFPHFARERLRGSLEAAGIAYRFLGAELGGRPAEPDCYDAEGRVLYARLAESPAFRAGIEAIEEALGSHRLAILCSEEDPGLCHRKLLVARVLAARGVEVMHLRGKGDVEVEPAAGVAAPADPQLALFAAADEGRWRSPRPVRGRGTSRG